MAVRLYERRTHAAAYLKYRVASHEIISRIMSLIEKKTPKKFKLAVDVGCGSGQGTILLAPHFAEVVGVDVSAAQLEMALSNNKPPNVSYRQGQVEDLPFASGDVDLVTAVAAAHWFDPGKFLQEADRVLRPGGCLSLISYDIDVELEHGEASNTLNGICKEFYAALFPVQDPYSASNCAKMHLDLFDSCSYPDKEWNERVIIKRTIPVGVYIGLIETTSYFQDLQEKDPTEAESLSNDIRNKLLSAMQASSPDTEVTMVVRFYYWLAFKPSSV